MILFDDLLKADDFESAVSELGREFREKYGLPGIHQLGLVVDDVETAAQKLEDFGMGPFFIASGSPVYWLERSKPRTFSGKLGIAYHKGYEIELLEPGVGSDFYRRSLDPESGMVIQHLGFTVADVDAWSERLSTDGYPVWVRGKLKAGLTTSDFAYMDTIEDYGIIIEFICLRLMGFMLSPPPFIFHTLGHIEKLTGKRCISV